MKTKFYCVALFASAALIAQAQASGHHTSGGGNFVVGGPGPARRGGSASFNAMPGRGFGGGRMIYSGQRFSSIGLRSPGYRQRYINPNGGNRAITNQRRGVNGAGQVRSGNNLPTNWRNHVVAQHSATWHRDWDRNREHSWHGHRCRFVNGSWFIFDFGFDPWWPYWYPYDYYGYGYPYGYGPGYYDSGAYQSEEYYGQNGYSENSNSTISAAQQRLAREGYYRGEIDGIFGPSTRRAIIRYQSDHRLRVTGDLTTDTLQDLGLRGS